MNRSFRLPESLFFVVMRLPRRDFITARNDSNFLSFRQPEKKYCHCEP
ncbi:MAG: hypothetical protein IKZ88_05820 [Neisseriaceae bacterium]|nr:hypothetical protein [Neisseriaceae bacterium]